MSYSETGVRQLWKLAFPLMLAQLSMTVMMFIDRLFLAYYSPQAFSAAVSAGTLSWAVVFGMSHLAGISTVFVAQHNGAKEYDKIGKPVWQMLWFTLFASPLLICIGSLLGPVFFIGSSIATEQGEYFQWMLLISPAFNALAAVEGFFIGRKHTQIITLMAVLGNLLNMVLDPLLIFGWGPIPSLGIKGACLATGAGAALQFFIFFFLFLRPKNRERFNTHRMRVDLPAIKEYVRVGLPDGIGVFMELAMWGVFYCVMSQVGFIHVMVASIGQTLILLFIWYYIGLQQALGSITGNLIGAQQTERIPHLMRSATILMAYLAVGCGALMAFFGESLINLFLNNPSMLEGAEGVSAISHTELKECFEYAYMGLIPVWAYIVLDGLRSMFHGALRGAGDTLFLMVVTTVTIFFMQVIPTYTLMVYLKQPVWVLFLIWVVCVSSELLFAFLRYRGGAWLKNNLLHGQG